MEGAGLEAALCEKEEEVLRVGLVAVEAVILRVVLLFLKVLLFANDRSVLFTVDLLTVLLLLVCRLTVLLLSFFAGADVKFELLVLPAGLRSEAIVENDLLPWLLIAVWSARLLFWP